MRRANTMMKNYLLLAALCFLGTLPAFSQSFCVGTDSPVGGSGSVNTKDLAQSLTMGAGCTGVFAGITIDIGTVVSDGAVWTLRIYQGNGFGGTLQYTQMGMTLTEGAAGYVFVEIGGGSGSLAFTSGAQYTFRLSTTSPTSSITPFRNTTNFYSGGQGYVDGIALATNGDILDFNIFTQAATSSCGGATRLYVRHNASGANNGTSWANAYTSLQSALDYAAGCSNIQEIWVSAGTYKPSKDKTGNASPSNQAHKTFYIDFPIAIYGGFAGNETMLGQRNVTTNLTILSGDIDNNDTANPATTAANVMGTNSSLVVHAENVQAGVTLDGFTVTAGNWVSGIVGGGFANVGTGYPFGSNTTVRNCRFMGNKAAAGASVKGNLGSNSSGLATAVFENCTFSGNQGSFGGGVFTDSNGGFTNCTFTDCTFSSNTASSFGGAIAELAQSGDSESSFTRCLFRDNSVTGTTGLGGAVSIIGDNVGYVNHSYTNCIFWNNSASVKGGGIDVRGNNSGQISTSITNCTFYNNSAPTGGAIHQVGSGGSGFATATIVNSIFWQNGDEIANEGTGSATLNYSLISTASLPAATTGSNNVFNNDPLFTNAGTGNFQLQNCSPARNTGTASGAPSTDYVNASRPALGGFDMGAYEAQTGSAPTTYYRDMDNDGFGDPNNTTAACTQPTGYVTNNTDCDDNDPLEKPGQVWYDDTDNDGYGQTGAASITQCLRPAGYRAASELTSTTGDCNDNNAAINPGATEICDGVDNNCNMMTDEGGLTTYYRDMDGDGFGNPAVTQQGCTQPAGYVLDNTDCDDNDALEKPGQVWYKDTDNDGYGQTGAASITQCLRPTGYKVASELTSTTGDCNDNNAAINPGATEICDGVDNNCNMMTDEGGLTTYYRDMDGDGFGNPSVTQTGCSAPAGYVSNNTDCDDNNALERPGQVWYKDTDNDGYGQTGAATITQCLRPAGYKAAIELTSTTGDCNDNNAAIKPGATELCDGVDNNCNMMTDEGVQTTYYRDMDGDGFGNPAVTQQGCTQPAGYVTNNTDCDDNDALEKPGQVWYKDTDNDGYGQTGAASITQCLRPTGYKAAIELTSTTGDCNDGNAAINPAATEICDGVDNDCDSMTDEGVQTTYYRDMDGDGFGNPAVTQQGCTQPAGYVTNNTDCDDNDALEKPGQVWYADLDNDGYSSGTTLTQCLRPTNYKVAAELTATTGDCNDNSAAINPAAQEICDGIDNNCNSQTDEGVQTTYYRDMDGDGFGNPGVSQMACAQPTGYVTNNTDCDDNDVLEKPGQVWYADVDGDGYSSGTTLTQCLRPAGYKVVSELTATTGDCNDNNAAINPAATEICNGLDDNCDGVEDEGVKTIYYRDMDGDGFGDLNTTAIECSLPQGYVTNSDDCDDTDSTVYPGAEEVCDSKDNDCNGTIDDIGGTTEGNWNSGDVGGANGSADFPPCNAEPNDVFTLEATGFSTSSSDKLQAVYQELCGNGEIIARVLNISGGGWGGIMLRETLDAGSKKVSLKVQANGSIRREIRMTTNGPVNNLNFNRPTHVWLRLTRNGNNFVGYTSPDGSNWSFAFSANVSMNGCIYAGLFSESINASATTTVTFDNVSIIRPNNNLDLGLSQPANLNSLMPQLDVNVYPNPTEGLLTMHFAEVPQGRVTIRVFNAFGKQVMARQSGVLEEATTQLNLAELADGVYTIQVSAQGSAPLIKRVVLAKASGIRP